MAACRQAHLVHDMTIKAGHLVSMGRRSSLFCSSLGCLLRCIPLLHHVLQLSLQATNTKLICESNMPGRW